MSLLPDQPQPISKVLDVAFNLYSSTLKAVLPLSIGVALISVALGVLTIVAIGGAADPMMMGGGAIALVMIVAVITMWFSMAFYGGIIYIQGLHGRGSEMAAWPALWYGAGRSLHMFLGYILYGIIVLLGLIALIIPGIFLGVALYLFLYAIVLERVSAGQGLTRSWELVKGNWWRALVIISVPAMVYLVVAMLAGMLVAGITGGMMAAGQDVMSSVMILEIINQLIGAVISAIFVPLLLATGVALFNDLILRSEGTDLEQRISAL